MMENILTIFDGDNKNICNSINNKQTSDTINPKTVNAGHLSSYPRPKQFTGQLNGLRSIEEIPSIYRNVFCQFQYFNQVQSIVFNDVFYSNLPLIMSAPTGSGKTAVFELAIIKLLMHLEDMNYRNHYTIIYIAPIKALCNEKLNEWKLKFEPLGLKCIAVTGDSNLIDLKDLQAYKIILTTPEKWDSLTRKWKDCKNIVESIKLFIIDEIHLLNEDKRGPILEAIVSRMKTIQFYFRRRQSSNHINIDNAAAAAIQSCDKFKLFNDIRFIAASATIPNIEDLAMWIGNKNDVRFHSISDELRPVQLEKHVIGYNCSNTITGFRFDMTLNYKLSTVIHKFYREKPILIFCSTRKGVEMAAKVLESNLNLIYNDNQQFHLQLLGKKFRESKLKSLIHKGISFHHAGLYYEDRNLIEDSFRSGYIPILLCTNTLAMGVNFPAHIVIVKSTETYNQGRCIELSDSSILQMIGRAGRPQFDNHGIAIIMTQSKNVQKYENLVSGTSSIESHLHKHLAEHLNSEIVLSTISDIEIAMEWIRSTFLYVRAIKNPINYGFIGGMTKEQIGKKIEEMCLKEINELEKYDLITKDKELGIDIQSTIHGRLMARYYLSFATMKLFKKILGNENIRVMFNIIIYCEEFSDFHLRVSDKRTLNELNKNSVQLNAIRFPIKGKIKNIYDKTSCLLQAILGNLPISDSSLSQEAIRMINIADRITKCLIEYIRLKKEKSGNGYFQGVLSCCILAKCFRAHLWEHSMYVSKQLKKIGQTYSKILAENGRTTIALLKETDPRHIENMLKKAPPFGNDIIDALTKLPQFLFHIEITINKHVRVVIKQINEKYLFNSESNINNKMTDNNNSGDGGVTIIIGDSNNNLLFFNDNVQMILRKYHVFERTFKLNIENIENDDLLKGYLIHHDLVGIDQMIKIPLNAIGIFHSEDFVSPVLDELKKSTKKTRSKRIVKYQKSTPIESKQNQNETNNNIMNDDDDADSAVFDDDTEDRVFTTNDENNNEINDEYNNNDNIGDEKKMISVKRKLQQFEYTNNYKNLKLQDSTTAIKINQQMDLSNAFDNKENITNNIMKIEFSNDNTMNNIKNESSSSFKNNRIIKNLDIGINEIVDSTLIEKPLPIIDKNKIYDIVEMSKILQIQQNHTFPSIINEIIGHPVSALENVDNYTYDDSIIMAQNYDELEDQLCDNNNSSQSTTNDDNEPANNYWLPYEDKLNHYPF